MGAAFALMWLKELTSCGLTLLFSFSELNLTQTASVWETSYDASVFWSLGVMLNWCFGRCTVDVKYILNTDTEYIYIYIVSLNLQSCTDLNRKWRTSSVSFCMNLLVTLFIFVACWLSCAYINKLFYLPNLNILYRPHLLF